PHNERYVSAIVNPDRRTAYLGMEGKPELVALEAENPECSAPIDGLAAFYPGDGVFEDIVGAATLAASGGVRFSPGRVGQAFLLDGESGYLSALRTGHYHFGHPDSTLALYVKFSDLEGVRTIFSEVASNSSLRIHLLKSPEHHIVFDFAKNRP